MISIFIDLVLKRPPPPNTVHQSILPAPVAPAATHPLITRIKLLSLSFIISGVDVWNIVLWQYSGWQQATAGLREVMIPSKMGGVKLICSDE